MPYRETIRYAAFAAISMLPALAQVGCTRPMPRPDAPHPRIISHSPAITQILFDMGLGEHIVGVTSYCVVSEGPAREAVVIGDMSSVNSSLILSAEPDLILTQTANLSMFKAATDINPDIRVESMKIDTLNDILAAITRIGELTGEGEKAKQAVGRMAAAIDGVRKSVAGMARPRVIFAMGFEHPSVMAEGSYLNDMIEIAGGINAGKEISGIGPWRSTSLKAIMAARPDVLIVFSASEAEGSQAKDFWAKRKDVPAVKAGRVFVVSDNRWMRPSPQLAQVLEVLARMIHPAAEVEQP